MLKQEKEDKLLEAKSAYDSWLGAKKDFVSETTIKKREEERKAKKKEAEKKQKQEEAAQVNK